METRTIQIANTKTQRRYAIETAATTLGELKAQLSAQGIDYDGMTFTEGISKTQLLRDDSLLPTNVNYRGTVTNNLVMLLTNTNKQIASGCNKNRRYAYTLIKDMGRDAAEEIKNLFGRNYTQVPTDKLWEYLDNKVGTTIEEDEEDWEDEIPEEEETVEESHKPLHTMQAPHAETVEWFYMGIKSLVKDGIFYMDDVAVLSDLITELYNRMKEGQPFVSDKDIDEMIANL